jgi:hypothetical protein
MYEIPHPCHLRGARRTIPDRLASTGGNVEFRISPACPFAEDSRRHILSTRQTVNLSKIVIAPRDFASRGIGYLSIHRSPVKQPKMLFQVFWGLGLACRQPHRKRRLSILGPKTTAARPCSPSAQQMQIRNSQRSITPAGLSFPFQGRKNILAFVCWLSRSPERNFKHISFRLLGWLCCSRTRVAGST